MFSREPFLYKNEIHRIIPFHCLQTSRGNLHNMFSGNGCCKIWVLCTFSRNHLKKMHLRWLYMLSVLKFQSPFCDFNKVHMK